MILMKALSHNLISPRLFSLSKSDSDGVKIIDPLRDVDPFNILDTEKNKPSHCLSIKKLFLYLDSTQVK